MGFLPHAHRISLLSPAPVSHIFHSCRPSMPRKQKAALVPTPIKQSHKTMVVSYRPQTLHDTIHTVLPGEVFPAIPSYSEFIAVRLFVFQLTASRRGWHRISDILNFSTVISTNSLTKRLTKSLPLSGLQHNLFQLTASRRGWPCGLHVVHTAFNISTHSLTKRLTMLAASFASILIISTHSLTKRLTVTYIIHLLYIIYFNSQPHEEADDADELIKYIKIWDFNSQPHEEADMTGAVGYTQAIISTHSLTKRLTMIWKHHRDRLEYFNSQPHEEADQLTIISTLSWIYFNSQPHEEADFVKFEGMTKEEAFQLTASRRGWRIISELDNSASCISTHSLTKRLTKPTRENPHREVFQLTASRRGWQISACYLLYKCPFQLTASRRGWQEPIPIYLRSNHISTHSLTKRLTILPSTLIVPWLYFNSQPHEEADLL